MAKTNKPSTQQVVELEEIKHDIVYLKSGSMRAVVMVSGINFDLKSEEEQGIILGGFQNFLNALDYSVQFVIHSRKLAIDPYINMLEEQEKKEPNELLKTQISEYREFIKSFVDMNAIMSKAFYVVVPYDVPKITAKEAGGGGLLGMFGFGSSKKKSDEEQASEEAIPTEEEQNRIAQLNQRVEQVLSGIRRIGLRAVRLNNEELTELFYNLYNPEGKEKSLAITKEMTQ